ncbi:MAG: PKD domain-containing protein [Flavobacteriales bacterium]|nr:PKD domain-containing protein [Flavobacteriales bacterium]
MRIALLASFLLLLFATSCKKTPEPCIETDQTAVGVGTEITFTSCSEKSLSYIWEISGPEGAPENEMGWSDIQFSHAFTVPGTYTVTLTAYEDFSFLGESASTEVTIVIG